MRDAIGQAFKAYHASPPGISWDEAVQAHWDSGVVINSPGIFCLARLVKSDWSEEKLLDCKSVAVPAEADTWMIWVAAGDLSLLRAFATPMKWVAFQHRTYQVKLIPWEKARKLFNQHPHPRQTLRL